MAEMPVAQRTDSGHGPVIRSPEFVGRERELAALRDAAASSPAVVLVEGEAGIGKTRLIQEFLSCRAEQWRKALVASCPPFRQPLTLGPVVDAVRRATDDVRSLPLSALAGALRPLFPEWADDLPPAPEPLEDAAAARYRLFRALGELLGFMAVDLMVVEDAHWADEASLEFLVFLTAQRPQPTSLVVTYRPGELPADSLLRRLSSRSAMETTRARIGLAPLDVAETALLVSSMLADANVSRPFADFLHQRTDGVPLAVEESVRLMGERGDLVYRAGEWKRRHLDDIEVPPTVRDAVLERAGRLGPSAQLALQAAAVLAAPASEAIVAQVAGLDGKAGRAGLAEALSCGLLADSGRGLILFRHVLPARAVYEAIPSVDRREMHRRAALALEKVAPPQVAELARHSRGAGDVTGWRRYGEQAADLALAAGDHVTAATLLLDLVTGAELPAGEVARLTNRIPLIALTGTGRYRDLIPTLRSLVEAGCASKGTEADIRLQIGRVLMFTGEYAAGLAELEGAIPDMTHNPAAAAHAMSLLGWPVGNDWPGSRHARWLRRAAEFTVAMPPPERLLVQVNRVSALLLMGDEDGWTEADRILAETPSRAERMQIARGYLNTGKLAMMWGRYADAAQRLARAVELAEARQYLSLREQGQAAQIHLAWYTGIWDGLSERSRALSDDENVRLPERMVALLVHGLMCAAKGSYSRAEADLRRVLDEAGRQAFGPVPDCMQSAAASARLWLAEGRVREALTITDEPAHIIATKGIWVCAADVVPTRISLLLAADRESDATGLVSAFARGLHGRNAPAPKAALTLCRAMLAEASGQHSRAAAIYGHAAAAWQALPRPYDALLSRERQASCLLAAGQPDAAIALLADVHKALRDLGASGDADRIARALRGHGVSVPRVWRGGRRGYGDQLSPRELEVISLVVAGRTNRQIAQELHRSPVTVDSQLRSAKRKLGVSTRTELALRAAEVAAVSHSEPHVPTGSSGLA